MDSHSKAQGTSAVKQLVLPVFGAFGQRMFIVQ